MGMLKITIGFGQIVGSFDASFDVEWPAALIKWYGAIAVLNLDMFQAMSVDCMSSSYTFYDTFLASIIYPIIIFALIWIVYYIRKFMATDAEERLSVKSQHWKGPPDAAFTMAFTSIRLHMHTCYRTKNKRSRLSILLSLLTCTG